MRFDLYEQEILIFALVVIVFLLGFFAGSMVDVPWERLDSNIFK